MHPARFTMSSISTPTSIYLTDADLSTCPTCAVPFSSPLYIYHIRHCTHRFHTSCLWSSLSSRPSSCGPCPTCWTLEIGQYGRIADLDEDNLTHQDEVEEGVGDGEGEAETINSENKRCADIEKRDNNSDMAMCQ